MAAPVALAYQHVHSMRLASGAEALAARVLLADGTAGFGLTANDDAGLARDMAAWDALGRSRGLPLHALLGGTHRRRVLVAKDELPAIPPDWDALRKDIVANKFDLLRIDPYAWGSIEMLQTIAACAQAFDLGVALLAPNGHAWELQYCAALAATIKGEDTRIIVRTEPPAPLAVSDAPGLGVDWSVEPAFAKIAWRSSP